MPSHAPIYTAGPSVTQKEIAYVTDAVTNGLNAHSYDYIIRLEKAMAAYVGSTHAIATSSCTGALHMSLWALGVGPGDEVIVPDMTWIASVAPVAYLGATPVFVDVEADTWCIDPKSVEAAITPRTKAIIAVHMYGHPADLDALQAIAKKHSLLLIEDAAPSLGSTLNGKRTGGIGRVGAFSFHGSKIAAAGEGGMICLSDDALEKSIRVIAAHGRDGGKPLTAARWGIKYNMSNLQAAFALAQIERMDELFAKKRLNYSWYLRELGGIDGLRVSSERAGVQSNCWQTSIVLEKDFDIARDDLMGRLKQESNVDTRPFFPPISSLPMVKSDLSARNPVAYRVGAQGINLPSRHDLTEEDAVYIAGEIRRILSIA